MEFDIPVILSYQLIINAQETLETERIFHRLIFADIVDEGVANRREFSQMDFPVSAVPAEHATHSVRHVCFLWSQVSLSSSSE